MQTLKLISGVVLAIVMTVVSYGAEAFEVNFTNSAWGGKKIPEKQQCQKFGGVNPMSPEIKITGIPQKTEAILLKFNDDSYNKMKHGGHGIVGMLIDPGTTEIIFPAIPGHTFDLPDGVFVVRPQKNPSWDKAGAYLPPCSGGQGNKYSVTVQASKIKNLDKKKFKKIARKKITMGRY